MNVFEEVEVASRDWTGYDPDLLKKAVTQGEYLERELSYETLKRKGSIRENIGTGLGFGVIVAVFVIFVLALNIGVKRARVFNYAYQLGQTSVLSDNIDYELEVNSLGENVWVEIQNAEKPSLLGVNRAWNSKEFN